MAEITFHAQIHEEDGTSWSSVAELPGCFASGIDLEELKAALLEAIEMCLPDGTCLRERLAGLS